MTTTRLPEVHNGLVTKWIDFTTPGPGSASMLACSSAIYIVPGSTDMVVFDPYYGLWIGPSMKCLASEHSLWWNQHSDGVTTDINLGPFQCPGGYTTATISTIDDQSQFVGCCPSGYKFQNRLLTAGLAGQCHSSLNIDAQVTALVIVSGQWVQTVTTIKSQGVSLTGVHVNGFQFSTASESPVSTAASTTSLDIATVVMSNAPSNTGSPETSTSSGVNDASESKPQINKLSQGARIGIGIGCTLSLILFICLLGAIVVMKRKRQATRGTKISELASNNIEIWSLGTSAPSYSEAAKSNDLPLKSPVEMWVPSASEWRK
ncbi:hypothetical protein PVAG01_07940 [Phlyctema vagabunda]|uniref:Uncharacterized protein n=1 Tax=Phlyctema vagabunda TaxID=108571 RepID=A0ABR4PDU7_9HELO